MTNRRAALKSPAQGALATVGLLILLAGCLPVARPPPRPSLPAPLRLAPLSDLLPAAGVRWVVAADTRALFAEPSVLASIPQPELDDFARAHGGIDVRSAEEVAAAAYASSSLVLVRQFHDPARVEAAFAASVVEVEGRAVDVAGADVTGSIVRMWGREGRERLAVATLGRQAVGVVWGEELPLRAAELFAQGRLRRARSAWGAAPLDLLAPRLGEAPLRVAAAGPFDGQWAQGLRGILAEATAAGLAARFDGDRVVVRVVVLGLWGDRAEAALAPLRDTFDRLAHSGLGHLTALDAPLGPPRFRVDGDCLTLEVAFSARALLRGLRDATVAGPDELFSHMEHAPP